MNAARRNAVRLASDAKLLFENRRYPSALALGVLSIEESGKTSILRGIAMSPDAQALKAEWKAYRSHRSKNTMWILPEIVAQGARRLEDLRHCTERFADHTALLDQLKQVSIYTDCLGNRHWSEPGEVIDEGLTKEIVAIADLFAKGVEISTKEIELWIEHMRPVYGKPLTEMKAALKSWRAAMCRHGLVVDGKQSFDEFVGS